VEAASYVTGPFASQLLADMGGGSWLRRLTEKDVPAAPVNTLNEVFADPPAREYDFPIEIEHPKMGNEIGRQRRRHEPHSAEHRSANAGIGGTHGRDSDLIGLRSCRDRCTAWPRNDLKQWK
jgi:crotonobetainyl-CoA:carnitine CoA-transferase CaiB-like acyl-CoA transferase